MSSEPARSAEAAEIVAMRPPPTTRLTGGALVAGRVLWLVVVLLTLALFVSAWPARLAELKWQFAGQFPASFRPDATGQVALSPWRTASNWGLEGLDGQLVYLGVLEGDFLVAVDGTPVRLAPGQPVPDGWLSGPIGSAVVITVQTGHSTPRNVTVIRGGLGADAFAPLGLSQEVVTTVALLTEIGFALVFLAISVILFRYRSDDWLALLVSAALLMMFLGTSSPVLALSRSNVALAAPFDLWFSLAVDALLIFFYLFPDGRFFPKWTVGLAGGVALVTVGALVIPALYPWRMPPLLDFVVTAALLSSGVFAQVARYRHGADRGARQQTKWVLFGLAAAALGLFAKFAVQVILWPPHSVLAITLYTLVLYPLAQGLQVLLPLAILFAILRYRLFDIDLIINRTLVYGSLSASVFAIYVGVVSLLGALLQTQGDWLIALPATVVVAVLFQPLRERLQRAVNRLMYGERDDPYAVIARLGRRLETAFEPAAVLPATVETVAQALKLPYAAITLRQEEVWQVVAQYGTRQGDLLRLPLVYAGATIGELLLAPRSPGEPFTASDHRLLADLARQAGVAANTVLLHTDLERSRQRIVVAREEARRKLGNDLHDGLGHRLAGLLRRQELAANLLRQNPAAAAATLVELNEQTRATIDTVRALAHTLHPPELELLGLLGALRERADALSGVGAPGLRVLVEAPETLPPLPAAVELAAYYIAQEALANVVRHAGARQATLRLRVRTTNNGVLPDSHTLEVEVCDDGHGLLAGPSTRSAGLGLASMKERAAELGGHCEIHPAPGGGTRVHAVLPCPTAG